MNLSYKRAIIWINVLKSFLITMNGISNRIADADTTVDIVLEGKSLIRFGDGEFGIFRGKDIHYQKWSNKLMSDFQIIKDEYEADPNSCPYLLALPKQFMTVSGLKLIKKRELVSSWAESRYQFKTSFDTKLLYGDSFLFEKKNERVYRKIWTRENSLPDIIFVHNSKKYAEAFMNRYHARTYYIPCPPKDAYNQIDALENAIQDCTENQRLDKANCVILISAGPAGKVLAYRLSHKGYQAIDTGHCWDDPLEGIY